MPWSASVLQKTVIKDRVDVTVRYSNGPSTFDETYKSYALNDPEWIQKTVANKIQSLDSIESGLDDIPVGSVPDPTPPIVDLVAKAIRKASIVNMLLSMGVVSSADQVVSDYLDDLRDKVLASWDKI